MLTNLITYDRYLRQEELEQRKKGERIVTHEKWNVYEEWKIHQELPRYSMGTLVLHSAMILFAFSVFAYVWIDGVSRYLVILGILIVCVSIFLFYRRITDYMEVYQSRVYLDRRGYNYRYTVKHYLYTLFTLSLYSFPIVLIATIGYERINEINMAFSSDTTLTLQGNIGLLLPWLYLAASIYAGFTVNRRRPGNGTYELTSDNYMQTYFSNEKIVVEGKYSKKSYDFSFTRDEIRSFVVLLLRKEVFYKLPNDALIGKRSFMEDNEFRDTLIVYLEDKRGYLHNISYYVQEEELQEKIILTLKEKYWVPVTRVQVQSLRELKNMGVTTIDFFLLGVRSFGIKEGEKFFNIKRWASLGTQVSSSEFIKKEKKREQMSDDLQVNETRNWGRESSITPLRDSNINLGDKLLSPYWYGMNDTIVWLMVIGVAVLNGVITDSLSIFFLTFLLGAPCFVIPTKKWYHLGIDKLPVCFALLCTLFYLL